MAKSVLGLLEENFSDRIEAIKDSVAAGSSKDYADYKEMCGLIRGLELARREVKDLSRKLMEEDNDD